MDQLLDQANRLGGDDTPKRVAVVLLWTFVGSFLLLIGINFFLTATKDAGAQKEWFDLLKSSFILLGTALTTVIGYYFGQRDSATARKEARAAQDVAKEKTEEVAEANEKVTHLKEQVDKIAAAIPTGMPEDFSIAKPRLRRKVTPPQ